MGKKDESLDDLEHYDDLDDQNDRTHIRGANNAYLTLLHQLREEPSVSDRDGLTRNHSQGLKCPKCSSSSVVKAGMMRKKGQSPVQMYKCKNCGHRFTVSSLGGVAKSKLPTTVIVQFVKCMTKGDTYAMIRDSVGVSQKTAIFWRFLLFGVAKKESQKKVLSGTVYIDEMYFRRNAGVAKPLGEEDQRKAKKKRGLSSDLVCVYLGIDSSGNTYAHVADKGGKPDSEGILSFWSDRIEKGSTLVHDGEKAHDALVKSLRLKSLEYNESADPDLAHKEMGKINRLCAYLRNECQRHRGIKTKNLESYLTCFLYLKRMRQKYGYKAYRVVAHQMVSESKSVKFHEIFAKRASKTA